MQVGWTPVSQECGAPACLMTLSVDKRLKILQQRGRRWETLVDVSQVLSDHLKTRPDTSRTARGSSPVPAEVVVAGLEARCYLQATNQWVWRGQTELITGQHSGHLALITAVTSSQPVVREVYSSQMTEISCLHHHTAQQGLELVLVAGADGRVEMLRLQGNTFSSLGLLWADQDRLKVSRILVTGNTVVLAKMNFCVFIKIKITAGCQVEFGEASHINTGMTAIVGLELYRDNVILSSQRSGIKICQVKTATVVDQVSLEVGREHYFCHGMAASRNKAVFACLENIATFHDHLILREPGRLVLWTLQTEASLKSDLLARSPEDLPLCPDILETYRLLVCPTSRLAETALAVRYWHYRVLLARTEDPDLTEESEAAVVQCEARLRSVAARRVLRKAGLSEEEKYFSQQFLTHHSGETDSLTWRITGENSWRCRICCSPHDVGSSSVSVVVCQSGHSWPRCVTTQSPVTSTNPLRCAWCKSLSLTQGRCSLCQGPLAPVGQKIS